MRFRSAGQSAAGILSRDCDPTLQSFAVTDLVNEKVSYDLFIALIPLTP